MPTPFRIEQDPCGRGVVSDELGPFASFKTPGHARAAVLLAEARVSAFFNTKQWSA